MALVFSVCNKKGGQGKSTTALSLAGKFSGLGKRVAVIDKDAQRTVSTWRSIAERAGIAPAFDVIDGERESAVALVARFSQSHDVVIVDLPGGRHDEAPATELLIVPTLADADSYVATVGALAELERNHPGKYRTFVFANGVEPATADHAALLARNFPGQPFVKRRRAFPKAFLRAATVYTEKSGVPNTGWATSEIDRVAEAFALFVQSGERTNHHPA